jgi:hypothetical protein
MSEATNKPVLLPDSAVARRYGVHPITLRRWDKNPDLGFPQVVIVNGRRYRRVAELDVWDLQNSREAASRLAGLRPRFGAKPPSPEAA